MNLNFTKSFSESFLRNLFFRKSSRVPLITSDTATSFLRGKFFSFSYSLPHDDLDFESFVEVCVFFFFFFRPSLN